MVNLSSGPPFPQQPDGAADAAQDLATQAGKIEGLASDVAAAHAPAPSAVGGTLVAPMSLAPVQTLQSIQQMSQTAVFAAGALQSFANAVSTYNTSIDRLNQRWNEGQANNFGVVAPLLPGDSTPQQFRNAQAQYEGAVNAARDRLREELRGEQRTAEGLLDDAADQARAMLRRGPNPADVAAMGNAGVFDDLWNSLNGQLVPPSELGTLGVGLWGLGRGITAFNTFADWMTKVRLGSPAFPAMTPLFTSQYPPWYRWTSRDTWLLNRNWSNARSPWLTGAKWGGRALVPLGVATSSLTQLQQDANRTDLSSSERFARTTYRATAETGGGLGAAAACAGGVGLVTSETGPGALVAGGVAGLACGILGKEGASELVDATIEPIGDVLGSTLEDAGDAIDKLTPWDGAAPW